ncbi:MAG: histone deacetylase [Desulfobacteraceae bacterium]|nr:histone deacetylase [Desulfobacteraceae bacterium]
MNKTGYVHDNRYLLHDTGPYHPENPDRLMAIFDGIKSGGLLDKLTIIPARPAEMKWISSIHPEHYIHRFEEVCLSGNREFCSADNQMCVSTYETAILAVGGVLEACRMVMAGELDNAFCAVRPPGHHAEESLAMGFCYFNNVAIAARYLQEEWGVERVGIIDFDVHHGNGTQRIFEEDPSVFYYSIHQHPSFAFPGTGREFEAGNASGQGYTKNSPVLPGKGDEEYKRLVENDMIPVFKEFKPDVLIVSTGFDAHEDDDMSDVELTTHGFSWIMRKIMGIGWQYASGRVISVLEGGYCIERLPELARNHMRILMGEETD